MLHIKHAIYISHLLDAVFFLRLEIRLTDGQVQQYEPMHEDKPLLLQAEQLMCKVACCPGTPARPCTPIGR